MAIILDGKTLSATIRDQLAQECAQLRARYSHEVGLAVVLVGDDPASAVYVRNKVEACARVGILSRVVRLAATSSTADVREAIETLNADDTIHGIIVQLPLPAQCDTDALLCAIDPGKDVDGLTPTQRGYLSMGLPCYVPCTPLGVMRLLAAYHINPDGQNAVVVGRSNLVGKPLASLLTRANATVTLCHTHTRDLAEICRRADLLCVSVGRAGLITPDMVREGATVVDVGITRANGRLLGDVDEAVQTKCAYFTPVPGGVGPMTVTMLLHNTLQAYRNAHS